LLEELVPRLSNIRDYVTALKSMTNDLSIDKRALWRYVNKKIKHIIHHHHVFSVLTILFDEIIKDLKRGKDIRIVNFGTFKLKDLKPRRYFDVVHQRIMLSEGHRILRFILAPLIRKKLVRHLDLDKTLKGD
jgi:nucleoid DNA-binding protein